MKEDFVVLDIGKIVIIREKKQVTYYKELNGALLNLNEEEQIYVTNYFDKEKGYIYSDRKISELISNNNGIENKEFISMFLEFLERIIPENSRDNFYKNVETLKIGIKQNNQTNELYCENGNYNTQLNSVFIQISSLKKIWEIAQTTSNPEEFYEKESNLILLHELTHMASSNYDHETAISLSGFDKYPPNMNDDKNRGLTEGMTEVIAATGIPGTKEIASGYYIEALFVNQLIQIVGVDVMLNSYFSNKGLQDINSQLNSLIDDEYLSYNLFRRIEDNYQIGKCDISQSILGNIQMTLIKYFEKKIVKDKTENRMTDNEINNSIQRFEQMLITPEKLEIQKKNPANYAMLMESLSDFEELKNSYFLQDYNSQKGV